MNNLIKDSAKNIIKNNGVQSYFDAKFNYVENLQFNLSENFYNFFLTLDFTNVVWDKQLPKLNRKNVRKLSKLRKQSNTCKKYDFVSNF